MKKITETLDNFTDTELAYLNKFRLNNYLPETQAKIKDYISKNRGLSQRDMNDLIAKSVEKIRFENTALCPRCKTDKLGKDNISESHFRIICAVCGLVIQDTAYKSQEPGAGFSDYFFDLLSDIDFF